jgi:aminoglycoside phosphotransferase family enzyme/predicted kinase
VENEDDPLAAARARVARWQATLERSQGGAVPVVETHISWVLLVDEWAYKVKKPVRLPFLDFTTLADRRRCCAEELRVNARFAPSIYVDVAELREGPGGIGIDVEGTVVEAVLRMRRFPDGALWSDRVAAATLTPQQVDAMAEHLARLHREATPASLAADSPGSVPRRRRIVLRLVAGIDSWQAGLAAPAPHWPGLRDWLGRQLDALGPLWESRLRDGHVRECHGDLHLDNVVQLGDEPTPFDAIEFDPDLRYIDVLEDLAFLVMDLLAHGRRDLAFRLLAAYLDATGDHDGVPTLRFFLVARALVRAQVRAIGEAGRPVPAGPGTAKHYLALAASLANGADPRLAITHGLPGSGKTFVSQALLEAAGALRVRSDVERKRLAGLAALQSSRGVGVPGGLYAAAVTDRTYARLGEIAQTALAAGWPTVVDAAFLRRAERARFAALADAAAVPFFILDCVAPMPLLRERVARRHAAGTDASEADLGVLEHLASEAERLDDGERAGAIVVEPSGPGSFTLAQHFVAAFLAG